MPDRNASRFGHALRILFAAALTVFAGARTAEAQADSPPRLAQPKLTHAESGQRQLSPQQGIHLTNWQADDIGPATDGAATQTEGAGQTSQSNNGYPGGPRPLAGTFSAAHGAQSPCQCASCRAGPLGLGIGPWIHNLLGFDHSGGWGWAQDRGPGPIEPWSHRPFGVSLMAGLFDGDTLIDGEQVLTSSGMLEFRAAHPVTDDFGIELRLARASTDTTNLISGGSAGEADLLMGDLNLQFAMANRWFFLTPRWQPYFSLGGGLAVIDFVNLNGVQIDQTVFVAPIGAGFRYRYNDAWALRFEFRDNIAPGGPLATMHNITLTGGAEWRFGGTRPSYGMWELR